MRSRSLTCIIDISHVYRHCCGISGAKEVILAEYVIRLQYGMKRLVVFWQVIATSKSFLIKHRTIPINSRFSLKIIILKFGLRSWEIWHNFCNIFRVRCTLFNWCFEQCVEAWLVWQMFGGFLFLNSSGCHGSYICNVPRATILPRISSFFSIYDNIFANAHIPFNFSRKRILLSTLIWYYERWTNNNWNFWCFYIFFGEFRDQQNAPCLRHTYK